jgi:hypothetical protein
MVQSANDALEILYTAAKMLALRTIPQGDRSFRTSWFHGFTKGVQDKLLAERNKIAWFRTGMEVVLRDRMDRASLQVDAEQAAHVEHSPVVADPDAELIYRAEALLERELPTGKLSLNVAQSLVDHISHAEDIDPPTRSRKTASKINVPTIRRVT